MSIQCRAFSYLSWIHRTVHVKGNGEGVERHKGVNVYEDYIKILYTQLRQWTFLE